MQSTIGCTGKGEVWKHEKPPDNVHKADRMSEKRYHRIAIRIKIIEKK